LQLTALKPCLEKGKEGEGEREEGMEGWGHKAGGIASSVLGDRRPWGWPG